MSAQRLSVKNLLANARDEWNDSYNSATDKAVLLVIWGVCVLGFVALFVVTPLVFFFAATEEPSFHCGEDERLVVKVEEVRFSKHNYGRAEVARCESRRG
jgi:beta-lactamase regulating signal transducer with metallopeptidase domain